MMNETSSTRLHLLASWLGRFGSGEATVYLSHFSSKAAAFIGRCHERWSWKGTRMCLQHKRGHRVFHLIQMFGGHTSQRLLIFHGSHCNREYLSGAHHTCSAAVVACMTVILVPCCGKPTISYLMLVYGLNQQPHEAYLTSWSGAYNHDKSKSKAPTFTSIFSVCKVLNVR